MRETLGPRLGPAILLDRDGVINRNREDYVKSWDEFEFLPGTLDALRTLTGQGVRVIVITNQSAVGRGIISPDELERIHVKMTETVRAHGGEIEDVLCCPHTPSERCTCRKPRPGLLLNAVQRHGIEPAATCFVGDSLSDLRAARAAGMPFVMVLTGKAARSLRRKRECEYPPALVARDLPAAVRWFLRRDSCRKEAAA